jgi:hypothetical protein
MFARLRQSYAGPASRLADPSALAAADAKWGLMAAADYRTILERTWQRDYRPRFARLGIDAAPAWAASEPDDCAT